MSEEKKNSAAVETPPATKSFANAIGESGKPIYVMDNFMKRNAQQEDRNGDTPMHGCWYLPRKGM